MSDILQLLWLEQYEKKSKLDKKMFYAQDDFNKSAEKKFVKYIESLHLIAVISEKTTNIPKVMNEDYRYEDIYVIHVDLKTEWAELELSKIIHSIIPNPVLIAYSYGTTYWFSVSKKRRSKADRSKQVAEWDAFVPLSSPDEISDYLQDMKYSQQSMMDQMRFYLWRCDATAVQSLVSNSMIDAYMSPPRHRDQFEKTYLHILELHSQIYIKQQEYKQQVTEWDKADIHMQIVALKKQQQQHIDTLFISS